MQNAYSFASAVGDWFHDAQCKWRCKNGFASHCWSLSKMLLNKLPSCWSMKTQQHKPQTGVKHWSNNITEWIVRTKQPTLNSDIS
jgi:hypothetical protein